LVTRINFICCLLLLTGWPLPGRAENWVDIGYFTEPDTKTTYQVHLDLDSVRRDGDIVKFVDRETYLAEIERHGKRYMRLVSISLLDCRERTFAVVAEQGWDRLGNKTIDWMHVAYTTMSPGDFWMLPEVLPELFERIQPRTMIDDMRARLCK